MKIETKMIKKENLGATIRDLGIVGVSLIIDQDQGAHTPLLFKLAT